MTLSDLKAIYPSLRRDQAAYTLSDTGERLYIGDVNKLMGDDHDREYFIAELTPIEASY